MDAYRIAFRIPNMLRDLFAEGRHERRVRADLHAPARRVEARPSALRLGPDVTNALLVITGTLVLARHHLRGTARRASSSTDEYAADPASDRR